MFQRQLVRFLAPLCATPFMLAPFISDKTDYTTDCRNTVSSSKFQKFTRLVISRSTTTCTGYSSYTYPANNPIEDRHVVPELTKKGNWEVVAVFDGHGGWQVSEFASKELLPLLREKIEKVDEWDELSIEKNIIESFEEVEQQYVKKVKEAFKMGFGEVAKVGSCVLVALQRGDCLVIANCGDCRAVLGTKLPPDLTESRQQELSTAPKEPPVLSNLFSSILPHQVMSPDPELIYTSTRLSSDHNAREPLEHLNLLKNHPGEPDLVRCKNPHACYVKGRLQLTRSIGDVYLKYHEFNGSKDKHRSSGRFIPAPYSPPYVSHVPDVHHLRLDKGRDQFVILATDGLWDYLTDQDAVHIVASELRNMSAHTEDQLKEHAAKKLVEAALAVAARERGLTLEELRALAPGRSRRSHHDDTTAVVMFF